MKKKIMRALALCLLPVLLFAFALAGCGKKDDDKDHDKENNTHAEQGDQVYVEKSVGGNPIGGFGVGDSSYDASWDTEDELWQLGERDFPTFAGDPSVLVANDPETGEETVYLYAGHDVSKTGAYNMPEWICYSSTDLLSWKAESIIMDIRDVPWANKAYDSAWAAQVIEYKGYYWFLFCSWSDNTQGGGHLR